MFVLLRYAGDRGVSQGKEGHPICNLNLTTNQQAIRAIAGVMQESLGNPEPRLDV